MKQMGRPVLKKCADLGGEVARCSEFCDAFIDGKLSITIKLYLMLSALNCMIPIHHIFFGAPSIQSAHGDVKLEPFMDLPQVRNNLRNKLKRPIM